jgi:hypothetical protein
VTLLRVEPSIHRTHNDEDRHELLLLVLGTNQIIHYVNPIFIFDLES